MFYYLSGTIAVLDASLAVVDCGGVGYACHTTAYTLSQLRVGQAHKLYTHCNIREDAFDIFGFASRQELGCFELLIGVNGVGPKAALAILSSLPPQKLTLALATGDEKALTTAPGIGKKLAQRILLELKDKLAGSSLAAELPGGLPVAAATGSALAEATAALVVLGYSQSEIGVALRGVDAEALSVEEIVRHCLRAMVMK